MSFTEKTGMGGMGGMGVSSRITLIGVVSLLITTLFVLTKDTSNLVADPLIFISMFLISFVFELVYNRFFNDTCNKEYNAKTASINAGMYIMAATLGYIIYGTFVPESKTGVLFSILKSMLVLVPANLWYWFHYSFYVYPCAPPSPPE